MHLFFLSYSHFQFLFRQPTSKKFVLTRAKAISTVSCTTDWKATNKTATCSPAGGLARPSLFASFAVRLMVSELRWGARGLRTIRAPSRGPSEPGDGSNQRRDRPTGNTHVADHQRSELITKNKRRALEAYGTKTAKPVGGARRPTGAKCPITISRSWTCFQATFSALMWQHTGKKKRCSCYFSLEKYRQKCVFQHFFCFRIPIPSLPILHTTMQFSIIHTYREILGLAQHTAEFGTEKYKNSHFQNVPFLDQFLA